MVQERAHRLEGGEDFAADLLCGTHRIHGNQDSAVAVPGDDWGCHCMVEGKALGNDVCSVVGAMLERSSREQPAHRVPHRRPAGATPHPRSSRVRGLSGRPRGLGACSAGFRLGQTPLLPPWRRSAPPAACRGRPGRARVRRGRDTPERLGRERSAAPRDRAAVHRSLCGGCRNAWRSVRPEFPCPRPGARSSVLACSAPHVIIPRVGRRVDTSAHRRRQRVPRHRVRAPAPCPGWSAERAALTCLWGASLSRISRMKT